MDSWCYSGIKIVNYIIDKEELTLMNNLNIENVTIPYNEYIHLLKLRKYVNDWYPDYAKCEICGNYHPVGCVCTICK